MKKKLISLLLLSLLLALLCPLAAFAEGADGEQSFPYVLDNANLLSDSQRQALEEQAAALSETHACSLYIVTMEDYREYAGDVYTCATQLFTYFDLGWGSERDGVILLLSTKERDYALAGHGSTGETICGRESSWLIEDEFLDNFRSNDWNGGFSDYLAACDRQLTKLENGGDVSEGANIITGDDGLDYHEFNRPDMASTYRRSVGLRLAAVIGIPLLVALITCSVFKAQMKTAKEQTRADEYLVPHSMDLRIRDDRFTHRTETRTVIESDSRSGGGGGGSSFHSGGGFSGRSGKF